MGNINMPTGIYAIEKRRGLFQKGHLVSLSHRKIVSDAQKGHSVSKRIRKIIGKANRGKILSIETKRKIGKANSGIKSHLWKGGITPENLKIRASMEFKIWRKSVFERDNYTCVWCGIKSGSGKAIILHADHIKSFAYHPELRLDVSNGRTLCKECHKKTDTWKRGADKINQKLNGKEIKWET